MNSDPKALMPVTCLLLIKNGSQYRNTAINNISGLGFEKIICVENTKGSLNAASIIETHPSIMFIEIIEKVSIGDMINIGMAKAKSPYVLVLTEEFCTQKFNFTPKFANQLISKNVFCVAPKIVSSSYNNYPIMVEPLVEKNQFNLKFSATYKDNQKTFFPFFLIGFYNREKYIQLGGMDYTISSEYWQKCDFFFRAWLWGERIVLNINFVFVLADSNMNEDKTVDFSYLRFYLKNLLPVYNVDHAYIHKRSFFSFRRKNPIGLTDSLRQFKDAKRWVFENRYCFKMDATKLIADWGK